MAELFKKDARTTNEHSGGFYYAITSISLEKILGKII
jgi:hypothetical protein